MIHYNIIGTGVVALLALVALVITGYGTYFMFHRDDIIDDSLAELGVIGASAIWVMGIGLGLIYLLGHFVIWAGQALGLLHIAS